MIGERDFKVGNHPFFIEIRTIMYIFFFSSLLKNIFHFTFVTFHLSNIDFSLFTLHSSLFTPSERNHIDFGPCTKAEGEQYGSDAVAHIEYLVAFCVGSRPFFISESNG